jgi:hypothetical protein
MAVSPNTNFTSGQILTAAQQNNFPRGVMGYVVSAAGNVTLTTSVADVTGLTLTFTAEANRGYKVSFNFTVQKDGTAGLAIFYVTDGANTINFEVIDTMAASEYTIVSGSYILTGLTAGSKTYKMRAFVTATTATLLRSADNKAIFTIEDIGPV